MNGIVAIPREKVIPAAEVILKSQGVSDLAASEARLRDMAGRATDIFRETAHPAGIIREISKDVFASIFKGEGRTAGDSPLGPIYAKAEALALFAVTIGGAVTKKIEELFSAREFPLGSLLDTAASEGTEMASIELERQYHRYLKERGQGDNSPACLRFSPGYCGWHLSGQRELFRVLDPGRIGIELRESLLMEPLKSISGVIVVGKKEIFEFEDNFTFCGECMTHACRDRIAAIRR